MDGGAWQTTQSVGSQRVRHNWCSLACMHTPLYLINISECLMFPPKKKLLSKLICLHLNWESRSFFKNIFFFLRLYFSTSTYLSREIQIALCSIKIYIFPVPKAIFPRKTIHHPHKKAIILTNDVTKKKYCRGWLPSTHLSYKHINQYFNLCFSSLSLSLCFSHTHKLVS